MLCRTTRYRRQTESPEKLVSDVTMPAVSWNAQFGDDNISTDLGRMVHNSFTIETSESLDYAIQVSKRETGT